LRHVVRTAALRVGDDRVEVGAPRGLMRGQRRRLDAVAERVVQLVREDQRQARQGSAGAGTGCLPAEPAPQPVVVSAIKRLDIGRCCAVQGAHGQGGTTPEVDLENKNCSHYPQKRNRMLSLPCGSSRH
jgi:hypothetical protein